MSVSLRLAFVVDRLGEGGAQRSALLTANAMHELGVPTIVVAALGGSYSEDVSDRVSIHLVAPSWPKPWAVAQFVWGLRRASKSATVDVAIVNGFAVTRIALLSRRMGLMRGMRVIVVEHNTLSATLRYRFRSRVLRVAVLISSRWLYRKADTIIGVSDGVSRDLESTLRLPVGSVATVHNPVDADRITTAIDARIPTHLDASFAQLPRPIIITAGRLVAQKAHRDLVHAFAALPDRHSGSLVILGEGPLRNEIEAFAATLNVHTRLWMPGFVENPWWFIARSDVFALSSHWEGHPLVLLEALACGTPIAATDCPSGPSEILSGTAGARLTPVGDSPALARSISSLLDDEGRRGPARRTSDAIEQYRAARVAAEYLSFVKNVLAR